MLASILRRAGKTLATRGNLNNQIGLPLMLAELEPDHQYALLEMGTSKKGDMDLLVDLVRPQVGLITNVGKDHLEFLGTPEGVLDVNRKLFDALPKDGIAVINLEDPLLKNFAGRLRLPDGDVWPLSRSAGPGDRHPGVSDASAIYAGDREGKASGHAPRAWAKSRS